MDIIEYLKTVDTPTLANAIETFHIRPNEYGFTPSEIRCIFPEFGRMVGYAVTAHVETISRTEPLDMGKFVDLYEAVAAAPKPAVIAFQEVGAHGSYAAHCGEVMSTIFTRCGAIGLVTDCAVRDIPEVRGLKFHYFSRGTVASHANFRIVRVGVTIQICGMVVNPGDILHGDENGVMQVPPDVADRIPAAVDAIRTRERALMDFVNSPEFSLAKLRGKIVE